MDPASALLRFFKALADESRLKIVGLLANGAVRLLERKALAWRRDFGQ